MKIFIVCSNLRHGGAERVAATLASGFHDRGHDVSVITNLFEPINFQPRQGVLLKSLFSTNNNKLRKWTSAFRILRGYIKSDRPDVIIGIMGTCSLVARIAALGSKARVVMTEHSSFERPTIEPFSPLDKIFKFHINKIYHHLTVLSERDCEVIGNRLKHVDVMPNPLCIEPVKDIPNKNKVVLAVARTDDWVYKGLDVLLKAWCMIQDSHIKNQIEMDPWWLVIAGKVTAESIDILTSMIPDGGEIKRFLGEDGQKSWKSDKYHIEFLGFKKDVKSLFFQSEIFVLSSRYEGFGLVLIEAMSQGCAPVACDYEGRQMEILSPSHTSLQRKKDSENDIILTENGILCTPDNVEVLMKSLKMMMEDNDYRHRVQRNAVERSKFYDMYHTMNRWEKYLSHILENS